MGPRALRCVAGIALAGLAAWLAACVVTTRRAAVGVFEQVDEVKRYLVSSHYGGPYVTPQLYRLGEPIAGSLYVCTMNGAERLGAQAWPPEGLSTAPVLGTVSAPTAQRAVDPRTGQWLEASWQVQPESLEDEHTGPLQCCGARTIVQKQGTRTVSRFVRGESGGVRDMVSFDPFRLDNAEEALTVHCDGDGDLVITGLAWDDELDRDLPLACNPRWLHAWRWRRTSKTPEYFGRRALPAHWPAYSGDVVSATEAGGTLIVTVSERATRGDPEEARIRFEGPMSTSTKTQ